MILVKQAVITIKRKIIEKKHKPIKTLVYSKGKLYNIQRENNNKKKAIITVQLPLKFYSSSNPYDSTTIIVVK